ncbi:peptide chain release factor N(5)-glutamine methyltransferase [Patescibacteria group bacterium]|nr:peptide chain release factor N(5)-glutamine methyltransferase [Patescibacteria group bacterium]
MKIKEILKTNNNDLIELLKYVLKKENIYSIKEDKLTLGEKELFKKLKKKLLNNMPIEYITKKAYFYKSEFMVNRDVLIPRTETETIIPYLLQYKNLIDIGCGSGAVGISIKKENPNINVVLSDISKKALNIAKINIGNLDIKLIQSDLTSKINLENTDCIFANLPYIKDKELLPQSVFKYEPHIALFGGKDGLFYIKNLILELHNKKWRGSLFLEMDDVQIKKINIKKTIIKDQFGFNRFIKIDYPILPFNIDMAFCN